MSGGSVDRMTRMGPSARKDQIWETTDYNCAERCWMQLAAKIKSFMLSWEIIIKNVFLTLCLAFNFLENGCFVKNYPFPAASNFWLHLVTSTYLRLPVEETQRDGAKNLPLVVLLFSRGSRGSISGIMGQVAANYKTLHILFSRSMCWIYNTASNICNTRMK